MRRISIAFLLISLLAAAPAPAQDMKQFSLGGDEYVAGNQVTLNAPVTHDAFAAGNSVSVMQPVTGDAHLAGNTVTLNGQVGGTVYAVGNNVSINAGVVDDVTAAGNNVSLTGERGVGGNVRLAGNAISIDAPVGGSALIAAQSVRLAAPVAGDFYFTGDRISFSDAAKIGGKVTIRTVSPANVPASVAPADRVTYERIQSPEIMTGAGDIARQSVGGFWQFFLPALWFFVVLVIIGVLWLALFRKRSAIAYRVAMGKPWKSLLYGIFSLSAFIGLVPVLAITVIGIPLIPIEIIVIVLAWLIGGIAGAYFVSMRVFSAFGMNDARMVNRLIALIVGIAVAWVLGLVPFLGWLVHLILLFLGLGGILLAALARWTNKPFHDGIVAEVEAL